MIRKPARRLGLSLKLSSPRLLRSQTELNAPSSNQDLGGIVTSSRPGADLDEDGRR